MPAHGTNGPDASPGRDAPPGSAPERRKLLRRGVTGFRNAGRDEPPPRVDFGAFGAACHAAARAAGAEVASLDASDAGPYSGNFHAATLLIRDRGIRALCNAHFPIVAFVSDKEGPLDFLDAPALASSFEETGQFEVADRRELEEAPDGASLAVLGAAELAQVRYWRPHRVGDIVFNRWD